MKRLLLTLAATAMLLSAGAKKVLDHDSFDDWKRLVINQPSNDGRWASYCANAQQGDGTLYFYNTRNGKRIELARGYKPAFTSDSRWAVALIKPFYADTRKAKIEKKSGFDLPQDSLAIVNLATGEIERIPNVISYKIGEKGGNWIAYQSCDTSLIAPKALKDTKVGRPLVVRNLADNTSKNLRWVTDYAFDKKGNSLAVRLKKHTTDSIATDGVGLIMLPDTAFVMLDYRRKEYQLPVFDEEGTQLAYLATDDSIESGTKKMRLFHARLDGSIPQPEEIVMRRFGEPVPNLQLPHSDDPDTQAKLVEKYKAALAEAEAKGLYINQYSRPTFSHNGKRLIVGVASPVAPNDTTIVDFEQPTLDIWRWDAPFTPPQEKGLLKTIRENTLPVVIDLADGTQQIMTTQPLASVTPADRWDAEWTLVTDPSETFVSRQWDYSAPQRLSIINNRTGERRDVAVVPREEGAVSPSGKYVYWFADRNWHVYDIAAGTTANVSADIPFPVWDEDEDTPSQRSAYGNAGWGADDETLLIYDRHDIWSVDPQGKRKPVNITGGQGRRDNLRYRYLNTDKEKRFLERGDHMVLNVFDYATKKNGLSTLQFGKTAAPVLRVLDGYEYLNVRKAKDADVFAFRKSNFSTSPDMWVCIGYDFAKARKISDINPQMKEYSWGTASLVEWEAYDGSKLQGVLYVPEDFDPAKKYPMLAVFYETGSERLYHHYEMEPSWSWVNYPFYVSRGYVIFQPDIHYTPGVPGESAYNCVCSGVEALCDRYEWIDRDHIGIDGQSWGGYQTAYLVTRTDMFAAAGSGAPVANMTSAFGGIRWGSGDSRQAQYEQGQSRIGRNLWDAPHLYMANSPVFYADRVHTPLLIMHNDQDEAVPWYQGIEMFMALRRLDKPVWMLTYNGESHNLKERRNRKDITVRLQQFFDHYLKGAPMPEWMSKGINPLRKGQELGY